MRSTAVIGAMLAAGSVAMAQEQKRAIEMATVYEYVTEVVWVTAEGPAPTSSAVQATANAYKSKPQSAPAKIPAPEPSSSAAPAPVYTPPPPRPSSSSVYVAPVAPTPAPAPSSSAYVAPPAPAPTSAQPAPQQPALQAPAPVSAPALAPAPSSGSFEDACVNGHNELRAMHNAPPLSWDADLAASAQQLAETCSFHHDISMGPATNYGQNIAASFGTLGMHDETTEVTSVITQEWYTKEAAAFASLNLYGMADPVDIDFEAWGHFSQEVWVSTTKVGCHVAKCQAGSPISNGMFTVCNYNPPGNYRKFFTTNVLQ